MTLGILENGEISHRVIKEFNFYKIYKVVALDFNVMIIMGTTSQDSHEITFKFVMVSTGESNSEFDVKEAYESSQLEPSEENLKSVEIIPLNSLNFALLNTSFICFYRRSSVECLDYSCYQVLSTGFEKQKSGFLLLSPVETRKNLVTYLESLISIPKELLVITTDFL